MTSTKRQQTVFIVDDDEAIRDALSMLIESVGLPVQAYPSGDVFIQDYDGAYGVLLLDVRMPGMSGLDLQQAISDRRLSGLSIIFMSGHGDIPMAVEALKRGADDFLQKPFRDQDLLDRIQAAMESNLEKLEKAEAIGAIAERIDRLTPREKQIMEMVADGKANKVIAMDLEISQRTVELHRSHVMDKMGVRSLAQLVRALERVRTAYPE